MESEEEGDRVQNPPIIFGTMLVVNRRQCGWGDGMTEEKTQLGNEGWGMQRLSFGDL